MHKKLSLIASPFTTLFEHKRYLAGEIDLPTG